VKIIPERHGQTVRQTAYCGITALCVASRGKKNHSDVIRIDVLCSLGFAQLFRHWWIFSSYQGCKSD